MSKAVIAINRSLFSKLKNPFFSFETAYLVRTMKKAMRNSKKRSSNGGMKVNSTAIRAANDQIVTADNPRSVFLRVADCIGIKSNWGCFFYEIIFSTLNNFSINVK